MPAPDSHSPDASTPNASTPDASTSPPDSRRNNTFLRRLASSGIWALIGRFASMFSLLINYRLVRGCLPDHELSIYVVALGLTALGSLISASGLGTVLLRRLSPKFNQVVKGNDRGMVARVFSLATTTWIVLGLAFVTIITLVPDLVGQPLDSVFLLIVFWVAARCTLTLVTEAFRGMQHFSKAALFGGLQEGPLVNLSFMACIWFFGSRIQRASDALTLHLSITLIFAILAIALLLRVSKARQSGPDKSDESSIEQHPLPIRRDLLAEGYKVLVSQLAIIGLVEYETLLVGRYCTDVEIGAWYAIRRLIAIVSGPLLLINAAIPSFIAELHSAGESKRLEKLVRSASTLATPPALIAFAFLYFFGEPILRFFDSRFVVGWSSLCLLAAANIVFVAAGSAGLTLRMSNRQGWATATTIALGILYLIASPFVISNYGLWGAATLASLMICARNTIATLLVRKFLGIWCIPSLRMNDMLDLIRRIRNHRGKKRGNRDKTVVRD